MTEKLTLIALIALLIAPASAQELPMDCAWTDSDLETGVYGPKGYWGDTNIAYAGFLLPSTPDFIYRFKGKFPNARYMSIESAVFLNIDQGLNLDATQLRDLDDVVDRTIDPDPGSMNPFKEGAPYPGPEDGSFTVDAVPEGVDLQGSNPLSIPSEYGSLVLISYRAVSPNKDVQIKPDDLPTIEALDSSTYTKVDCSPAGPVYQAFLDLVASQASSGMSQEPDNELLPISDLLDVSNLSELVENLRIARGLLEVEYTNFEKWWPFRFRLVNIPFEGSAGIQGYLYGLTQMDPGKVAIIRFRAPSFLNTYAGDVDTFTSRSDLRYWSMCALDYERGQALACMPDHMTRNQSGFVTIVYGPKSVEGQAEAWGYAFMEDKRPADGKWDVDKALSLVYRQLLPSPLFKAFSLNRGDYVPKARVCSESQFLRGWCRIY